jgi:plasmid stabilization system protein ParE
LSAARFVLSAPATSDLREIHDYIATDDPTAARRVLDDLRDAMRRLAELPGLGHARDDLADETLRVWTVPSYLVIYRPETRPLQVVRVLSGYRDIAALFE